VALLEMPKEEGEIECPIEGCRYSNTPSSVEAHVTSSTDGGHQGELGIEHRPTFPTWAREEAHDRLNYESVGETSSDRSGQAETDDSGSRLRLPAMDGSEESETASRGANHSRSGPDYHSEAGDGGSSGALALLAGAVAAAVGVVLDSKPSDDEDEQSEPASSSASEGNRGLVD